ncbi:MAG: CHAT domain-containing protein [bacterium]|nr:CHAT domain-containing protein [bacterium]
MMRRSSSENTSSVSRLHDDRHLIGRSRPFAALLVVALAFGCAGEAARQPTRSSASSSSAPSNAVIPEAEPPGREKIDRGVLVLRVPAAGTLVGERTVHVYRVELRSEHVLHVRAEQHGIDLIVKLFAADGVELREIDTPTGHSGPEDLWFLTRPGPHRIEVSAPQGSGNYRLLCEARALTVENRRPADAQTAHLEGEAHFRRREYDLAASAFRRARELWQRAGLPRQAALTLVGLARAEVEAGRRAVGIDHYKEALASFHDLSERRQEVRVLNNLGGVLLRAGNLEDAEARYQRAVGVARQVGHRVGEASALHNLALISYWRGEAQEALAHGEQALEIWRELGDEKQAAQTLQNMASCYLLFDQWGEALAVLQQAHRILKPSHDRRLFYNLETVGWLHYLRGKPQAALRFYRWADRLKAKVSDYHAASLLDRMGTAYTALGDWSRAEDAYTRAREILTEGEYLLARAHTLANLCRLYLLSGDPEAGAANCRQALAYFRETGDADGQASVLYLNARLARHQGDLHRARDEVAQAIDLLEALRARLHAPLDRSSFLAGWFGPYELYLDVLMELSEREPDSGWDAQVLAAIERTRARSLLELLAEAQVELRQGVDRELLDEKRRIRTRLGETRRLRLRLEEEGVAAETLQRIALERRLLMLRHGDLQRQVYAGLTRPQPLYLDEIQQLLDDETLLLFYALGDERSVLCLVSRTALLLRELRPRAEIEPLARTWYELLSDPRQQWAAEQRRVVAASLSQLLLEPVADHLGRQRLVVLGDGALLLLPFHALPKPGSGTESRRLLEDHEVAYLPSASTLAILRESFGNRPEAPGLLAVVVDPVFDASDERLAQAPAGHAAPLPGAPRFQRLRYARDEADAILAAAPPGALVALLEGFQARRENVSGDALRSYRIVHFATHAIVDNRPELSRIVLAQVDESGRPRPGSLDLQDIYDLDMPAELVVLSACRTALGPEVRGEGLIGMTRGFMHAGASRVLVSLWSVEDEATAVLMERFYRALLRERLEPAAALRSAQLSMQRETTWRPYHWAGFVLQGEWGGFDVSVESPR